MDQVRGVGYLVRKLEALVDLDLLHDLVVEVEALEADHEVAGQRLEALALDGRQHRLGHRACFGSPSQMEKS